MDLARLALSLETRLSRKLTASRAAHSRSVAELAAALCSSNDLQPQRGLVAGLGHDLCKEMGRPTQEHLASIYQSFSGRSLEGDAILGSAALHGPAAAGLLLSEFGCQEEDILEAIALHTLGGPEMGDLAKIVYAADKLEPGRAHVDPLFREACLAMPPDGLFYAVLASTIEWLRSEGLPIAETSFALYGAATSGGIEA
ncbi:MAG: bis(5'-nucleosyl)-tetraphosphatase (symmetrical) YqeK [Treponema sp.]|nr:bis(5'-nucleosyl)-tetraphosphatase (symmetrical) YqeK [Treponema sp.]